jgi:hypothetical protein
MLAGGSASMLVLVLAALLPRGGAATGGAAASQPTSYVTEAGLCAGFMADVFHASCWTTPFPKTPTNPTGHACLPYGPPEQPMWDCLRIPSIIQLGAGSSTLVAVAEATNGSAQTAHYQQTLGMKRSTDGGYLPSESLAAFLDLNNPRLETVFRQLEA